MEGAPGFERVGRGPGQPPSYHVDDRGPLRRGLDRDALREAFESARGRFWVHIDSEDDAQWDLLSELFGFHPLAVEDTRSPDCRIKLETYDGYLFIVVRGLRLATWTPEPYDIETPNLYLFLGGHFLVTVRAGRSTVVDAVRERLEAGPELLRRGVDRLAYTVIDTLVDFYFPLLDELDRFVDGLEDELFEDGRDVMPRIFALRRTELALRRNLTPMREVLASVANRPTPYLGAETQLFFRDVYDHLIRQVESVDIQRERLTGVVEVNLSSISNRTNEVVKSLSIVATLVLPATLVASIYGMNFEWMPALDSPSGFWLALAAMLIISGAFLLYFWRKGWL